MIVNIFDNNYKVVRDKEAKAKAKKAATGKAKAKSEG